MRDIWFLSPTNLVDVLDIDQVLRSLEMLVTTWEFKQLTALFRDDTKNAVP